MRVVITHDFYESFGGAERVTAEIAAAFPDAPVYAVLGRREVAERMGMGERAQTVLSSRPALLRHYRLLAPVYPGIVRSKLLPRADLVIASSYAYAHGFRTMNNAPVVCYCHGPLRHLWSQQSEYADTLPGGRISRRGFGLYTALGRTVDRAAARTVQTFLTQSPYTAGLIGSAYGRSAQILPPPVDCSMFIPSGRAPEDYFLFVGRLVEAYKKPSLVVDAFARMPHRRLLVAGDGPAMSALQARAPKNVTFLGRLDDADLRESMQGCQAAIFPSVDDFGLVPLEVNACGRPVLALGQGGARYTVKPGVSGEYLTAQTVEAVVGAVEAFDPSRYDPKRIRAHALQWHAPLFRARLREIAEETVAQPRAASTALAA